MALVLLCTVPSGDPEIVRVRNTISSRLRLPRMKTSRSLRPAVVHSDRPVGQDASRLIYVGCGRNDPQSRPSPFFNPFFFLHQSDAIANDLFRSWLAVRMDLEFFLQPLLGMTLLCDCNRGLGCHVHTLLRVMDRIFPPPGACSPHFGFADIVRDVVPSPILQLGVVDTHGDADLFDSDDSGHDGQVSSAWSRPDEIAKIDETRRGTFTSLKFGRERPTWPKSWLALISSIRMLGMLCFWEIFAGAAGLTSAFANAGWPIAPPIDIFFCAEFGLLNPLFLGVCLGIIFGRRIRLLHVGPPCSSFSMACNGCMSTRMRSAKFPGGLPELSDVRRDRVTLGNALAEVAVKLCQAQSLAGGLWTWEQPWSSLMWIYHPVQAFLLKYREGMAYVDVCAFGAPWKMPTGLAANFHAIEELFRLCTCMKPHTILRGPGPGGKAWTAIASPYWPAFAAEWAVVCNFCKPCHEEFIPAASHLSGFGVAPDDVPVDQLLAEGNVVPSAGASIFTSAVRVAAGVQPPGRKLPTLLPEGLGPDEHLRVGLGVQHPFARRVRLKQHIHHALGNQHKDPCHLNSFRNMVVSLVVALSSLLLQANQLILECVDKVLLQVLGKKNLALMRELTYVVRCPDTFAVLDLVWGLPMAGWARHSPHLVQRLSNPPLPLELSLENVEDHNLKVLASVRPTGDDGADALALTKC